VFIIGLVAAAYSSADSTLAALTTAFCIDFLHMDKKEATENQNRRTRTTVHIGFAVLTFIVVNVFYLINNEAVINKLFEIAGYTYGPLLGLFAFGLVTRNYKVRDSWVPLVCIAAPILSYFINTNSASLFSGFKFGFLIVALNGLITFLGLWAISYREVKMSEI
jgi:Na+/proline symporter